MRISQLLHGCCFTPVFNCDFATMTEVQFAHRLLQFARGVEMPCNLMFNFRSPMNVFVSWQGSERARGRSWAASAISWNSSWRRWSSTARCWSVLRWVGASLCRSCFARKRRLAPTAWEDSCRSRPPQRPSSRKTITAVARWTLLSKLIFSFTYWLELGALECVQKVVRLKIESASGKAPRSRCQSFGNNKGVSPLLFSWLGCLGSVESSPSRIWARTQEGRVRGSQKFGADVRNCIWRLCRYRCQSNGNDHLSKFNTW